MLAPEKAPSTEYIDAFREAFANNRNRIGRDVASLAKALALRSGDETVLVSLARAGAPVGVLLKRTLFAMGRKAVHYSISIIRSRGIDLVAMRAILAKHSASNVVFVDGWTGKGAIGNDTGKLKVTKEERYFRRHLDIDKAYSWGFRWVAGSKD